MRATTASPRIVRLTRRSVYVWTAMLVALVGAMFSTAALAAGVQRVDVLAMLFFLGAAGSLLAVIVWYLLQLNARARR